MLKNTANQKWIVFAFDATTGLAKTGDAANITANLRKDYGSAAAITDTNPTELEDGFYAFDMAQAETNADHLLLCPQSSTSNIVVIACPAVIFTEPTGRKYPASLAAADVSGNVPVDVTAIQSGLALDSTVMKSAGYTAPPSASDIASAVWSAVTRTLTAFSDSSGITTLLSRIGDALSITDGKVDINDKTGFALADGQAMTAAKVVIDNQNNTIKLYNVDNELIVTYTKTADGSVHTLSRS